MLEKLGRNKKGFTLAELLIVVAIIAVLVAIAIPVFSGALDSAKQATDDANIRAAYAQYTITAMIGTSSTTGNVSVATAAQMQQAFEDVGVTELVYYATVTISADGTRWVGAGTGGSSSISATT